MDAFSIVLLLNTIVRLMKRVDSGCKEEEKREKECDEQIHIYLLFCLISSLV
jgi:hypothetical protein